MTHLKNPFRPGMRVREKKNGPSMLVVGTEGHYMVYCEWKGLDGEPIRVWYHFLDLEPA